MTRAVALAAGLAVVTLAAPGRSAEAQSLDGTLVVQGSGAPFAQAFVILRDMNGREVARTLTDADGRFTFTAAAGPYQLQTARVGWQPWFSPPLDLPVQGALRYTGEVPFRAVGLSAVVVRGERTCGTALDVGREVARVWEEAKKALNAVAWTQRAAPLTFDLTFWQSRLHARTLDELERREERRPTRRAASPFASAPIEVLSRDGYIVENDDGDWEYFAPDAEALLSPVFAGDHCFFVREHPADPSVLGLGFEPVPDRDLPDIEGTLWLDRASAKLELLEFGYANLPWRIVGRHRIGGSVAFAELQTGGWIVWSWRLRMPLLTLAGNRLRWDVSRGYGVAAYVEMGGEVTAVRNASGGPVERRRE